MYWIEKWIQVMILQNNFDLEEYIVYSMWQISENRTIITLHISLMSLNNIDTLMAYVFP